MTKGKCADEAAVRFFQSKVRFVRFAMTAIGTRARSGGTP